MSKFGNAWLDYLLRVSSAWNLGVSWTEFSHGGLGRKSTFKFILAINRIQFLAVLRLRSPFPCRLSARSHSWLLETTLNSKPHGSLHLYWGQQLCVKFFSHVKFLTSLLWLAGETAYNGLMWLDQTSPHHLSSLRPAEPIT